MYCLREKYTYLKEIYLLPKRKEKGRSSSSHRKELTAKRKSFRYLKERHPSRERHLAEKGFIYYLRVREMCYL